MRVHAGFGEGGGDFFDELGMAKLPGGEVYEHPQWCLGRELLSEDTTLAADLREHPPPQGDDHARLFGQRDELRRDQRAPLRVLPPQQSLKADRSAGTYPHLGLVVNPELLAPYRAP